MKKCITMVVFLCVIMSFCAFANNTAGLEAAVMKVKTITEIPEELTEFDYHLSKRDGLSVWRLSWNDKNYEIASLSAAVAESGDIIELSRYDYVADKSGETIAIEEAIETAKLYCRTIMDEDFAKMQLINEDTIPQDSYGDAFVVKFARFENGIRVDGQMCELCINKYTGVMEKYAGFIFDRETVYSVPDNVIGRDKALSSFAEQQGVQLQYRLNYNFKTEEVSVYPAYFLNGEFVIDAVNGQKTEISAEYEVYKENMLMSDSTFGTAGMGNLSPQEQAAVDELGTFIDEEKASAILTEKVKTFEKAQLRGSYLGKNGRNNYVLNLEFEGEKDFYGSAAIDAVTGEIMNFYISDSVAENVRTLLTENEKKQKIEAFARLLAGDKFDSMVSEEKENGIYYTRMVNGIKCVGEGIRIGYNKEKDFIYSYSLTWTDVEEFPDVDNVLNSEKAVFAIADRIGFDIYYMKEKLVYGFEDKSYSIFSPYTGNPLKYDGSEYKENKLPEYTDISGHWCENTVKKLLENNVSLEGDKFLPDNEINRRDFVKMVYSSHGFENDDDIAEYVKTRKLFGDENLESAVTRNEAAKVFAEKLGFEEIAEKAEIFALPFKDSVDNEFNGYIAVCKAYGIVSGDGDGSFRGAEILTRAESAAMLYNYMRSGRR